jgi:seryl-tRNA synthetase
VKHGHTRCCRRCSSARTRCTAPASFPTERSNIYRSSATSSTSTGTSEVALAACHGDEILEPTAAAALRGLLDELPARSRARGKDTRGMFRVHQFDKVEMFVFTFLGAARRARTLLAIEEESVQELGFRTAS